jgi:hypothetical protein
LKKIILATDTDGYMAWHRAAEQGNLQSLEKLWIWSKEVQINTDELLLPESEKGYTAFHLAVNSHHVETLKKLCVWAKQTQIYTKDLMKDFSSQRQLWIQRVSPSSSRRQFRGIRVIMDVG